MALLTESTTCFQIMRKCQYFRDKSATENTVPYFVARTNITVPYQNAIKSHAWISRPFEWAVWQAKVFRLQALLTWPPWTTGNDVWIERESNISGEKIPNLGKSGRSRRNRREPIKRTRLVAFARATRRCVVAATMAGEDAAWTSATANVAAAMLKHSNAHGGIYIEMHRR